MERVKISKCYCEIPLKKLVKIARLRFVDHVGTQELMNQVSSEEDRECVTIVALLDVKENDLIEMLQDEEPSKQRHILSCRERTKAILERYEIKVEE